MDARLEFLRSKIVEVGNPDKIILFGSHARGTATGDSDFDLLVIGPSNLPRQDREYRLNSAIFDSGIACDLMALTQEEVDARLRIRGPFIGEILSTGKVIYERHEPV